MKGGSYINFLDVDDFQRYYVRMFPELKYLPVNI